MYKAIKTKIAALLMVILTVVGIGSQAISARAATEVEAAEKTASWQKKRYIRSETGGPWSRWR